MTALPGNRLHDMHDHPVLILAAVNLGMEAVHKFIDAWMPVFNALVTIGQIAVAAVTVVYILRKIHLLKKKSDEKNPD